MCVWKTKCAQWYNNPLKLIKVSLEMLKNYKFSSVNSCVLLSGLVVAHPHAGGGGSIPARGP